MTCNWACKTVRIHIDATTTKILATFETLRWCQVILLLHLHCLLRNWASRDQQNKCIKSTGPKRLMNWVSNISIVMISKIRRHGTISTLSAKHYSYFSYFFGLDNFFQLIFNYELDWPLVNGWKQEFKTWNMKLNGKTWLDKMTEWVANILWIMVLEATNRFCVIRRLLYYFYYCLNLIVNGV